MKMNIAFAETPVRMSVSSYRHRGHFVLLMGHRPYIVMNCVSHQALEVIADTERSVPLGTEGFSSASDF